MNRNAYRNVIYLLLLTGVLIFLYGQIAHTVPPYSKWDLVNYRAMAAAAPGLALDLPEPFAYRILGPYIVGLLPLDDATAFYAVSVALSLALSVLFYLFLCAQGNAPNRAFVAALLLVLNRWVFGQTVWNFFQVNDLLALVLLLLSIWALLAGRWWLYGLAFLLGALTREVALLAIPVALVLLWERRRLAREWRSFVLASLPGLAAFVLIRLLVPAWGTGLFEAFAAYVSKLTSPAAWYRLVINAFLPLSLIPLVAFRQTAAFLRTHKFLLALMLLTFVSALFGSNNERLMAPAALAFYWLIAALLPTEPRWRWVAPLLIAMTFLASLHHTVARFPLPSRTLTLVFAFGSLAACTLAFVVVEARERRLGLRPHA